MPLADFCFEISLYAVKSGTFFFSFFTYPLCNGTSKCYLVLLCFSHSQGSRVDRR